MAVQPDERGFPPQVSGPEKQVQAKRFPAKRVPAKIVPAKRVPATSLGLEKVVFRASSAFHLPLV